VLDDDVESDETREYYENEHDDDDDDTEDFDKWIIGSSDKCNLSTFDFTAKQNVQQPTLRTLDRTDVYYWRKSLKVTNRKLNIVIKTNTHLYI
jgi:hypothetical protein